MRRQGGRGKMTIQMMVIMAMMIAIEVVLSRWLTIWVTDSLKFAFNFVPVAIVAYLYGPVASLLVAGIGDLIGSLLFAVGAYFPGFTITAFFVGAVYGIFLHKKQDMQRIILAILVTECIGSLLMNTFWISTLFGAPFVSLLPPRCAC